MKKTGYVLLFLLLAGILAIQIFKLSKLSNDNLETGYPAELLPGVILADSEKTHRVALHDVIKSVILPSQVSSITPEMIKNHRIVKNLQGITLQVAPNQMIRKGDFLTAPENPNHVSSVRGRVISLIETDKEWQIKLLDYDLFIIPARLPQKNSDRVSLQQMVAIKYNDRLFEGAISWLDHQVVDGKVAFQVQYVDEQCEIRPGSEVEIIMIEDRADQVVAVPTDALITSDKGIHFVQVVRCDSDYTIETRPVRIGLIGNDLVEIVDGVAAGDLIRLP